jgi:hypothetical protein
MGIVSHHSQGRQQGGRYTSKKRQLEQLLSSTSSLSVAPLLCLDSTLLSFFACGRSDTTSSIRCRYLRPAPTRQSNHPPHSTDTVRRGAKGLLLLPERDAARAGHEHLLFVAERRRRGGHDRGGGLGVGGWGRRLLEAEERALRPFRREIVRFLGGRRLCGGIGALPLLRHGSVQRRLGGGC